ncbi:hypothetical protein JW964_02300 [candidate division KSB1 bacterium]|nr:hypothetical protein [candidate division KSB1 bacterium]
MYHFRIITTCFFIFILVSTAATIQKFTYGQAIEVFVKADIILVGDLIKRDKTSLESNLELFQHFQPEYEINSWRYDNYTIKVDSVLKGSYHDSTIIVNSQPYIAPFDGAADKVHGSLGKYIFFIQVVKKNYISILAAHYAEEKISFLKDLARPDSLIIKTFRKYKKGFN